MIFTRNQYKQIKRRLVHLVTAHRNVQRTLDQKFPQENINGRSEGVEQYLCSQRALMAQFEETWRSMPAYPSMPELKDLPHNLIIARLALGMSRSELGRRMGTSRQQIRRYEECAYENASLRRVIQVRAILQNEYEEQAQPVPTS